MTGTKTGDVNGDGKIDSLQSFFKGSSAGFRVLLGGGGGFSSTVIYPQAGNGATKILGLTALQGQATPNDHTHQVFAKIGNGASTRIVGLFHYKKCALKPVTFPGGATATIVVGAGIMHADGAVCDGVAGGTVFAVRSANSNDGQHFSTTVQGFRYANGSLAKYGALIHGSLNLPADAAQFQNFGTIENCGPISSN